MTTRALVRRGAGDRPLGAAQLGFCALTTPAPRRRRGVGRPPDETGVCKLVIWKTLYEKARRIALGAHLIGVDGRIQRDGEAVHLVAYKLFDLNAVLGGPQERGGDGATWPGLAVAATSARIDVMSPRRP